MLGEFAGVIGYGRRALERSLRLPGEAKDCGERYGDGEGCR